MICEISTCLLLSAMIYFISYGEKKVIYKFLSDFTLYPVSVFIGVRSQWDTKHDYNLWALDCLEDKYTTLLFN